MSEGKSAQFRHRKDRLAAALRENLKRRRVQAKTRAKARRAGPNRDSAEIVRDKAQH